MEDWGEEIFSEGVGVKWNKWARGERKGKKNLFFFHLPNPIPCLHQPSTSQATVTIQDGGIEPIYLAIVSHSEITPALQANMNTYQ